MSGCNPEVESLCVSCQRLIDMHILWMCLTGTSSYLGTVGELLQRPECAFCQLILSAYPGEEELGQISLPSTCSVTASWQCFPGDETVRACPFITHSTSNKHKL